MDVLALALLLGKHRPRCAPCVAAHPRLGWSWDPSRAAATGSSGRVDAPRVTESLGAANPSQESQRNPGCAEPCGISERLTRLPAPPCSTLRAGGPMRAPAAHPHPAPGPSAPLTHAAPPRPCSLPPGHEAPAALPAPFRVTELGAASVGRDRGRGGTACLGVGWAQRVHRGCGVLVQPPSPFPCPFFSGGASSGGLGRA